MLKEFAIIKRLKRFLHIPVAIAVSCLVGYLLLVMVYCIPTENMEKHVKESVPVFLKEGDYPKITGSATSQLDNFTDALMLLTASYPVCGEGGGKNVWKSALDATRYDVSGESPLTALIAYYDGNKIESLDYQHYWHGYLLFLKPLLYVFNYTQIRYIVMVFQFCLFSLLMTKISGIRKEFIVPTLIMWLFLNPIATMCSLQFNSVLILTFVSMILIIQFREYWQGDFYKMKIFFLLVGVLTSYFDLLTYPLVTLGVPITLWVAISFNNDKIRSVFGGSAFWIIGYGGMWAGKWFLASLVTEDAVIEKAMERIIVRTSSIAFDKNITYGSVLKNELKLAWNYLFVIAIVIMIYFVLEIISGTIWGCLREAAIYVIIGIYPFIWFFISKNHSYVHWWFAYRELVITVYALLIMIFQRIGVRMRKTIDVM